MLQQDRFLPIPQAMSLPGKRLEIWRGSVKNHFAGYKKTLGCKFG
jgi:hypothetical protein